MREDFCAFILSHGRPDNIPTYRTLKRGGYTGKIFIVIDDEDKTGDEYRRLYPDEVLTFSKKNIALAFDEADNFNDRRAVFYARNASFSLARQVGCRYFVQLDDDYHWIGYKWDDKHVYGSWPMRGFDGIFNAMIEFLSIAGVSTVAFSQGGDHMQGKNGSIRLKRKAMNSFFCDAEKPFPFLGRVNEDVNTYVALGRQGKLFFTFMGIQLIQGLTQSNPGGMTDIYMASGTYTKSFYSVMFAPSCVSIRPMGLANPRLHHAVKWDNAVPRIIREEHRKAMPQ